MNNFLAFMFLVIVAGPMQAAEPKADRPNILFIFSDDHATQAISSYGGRFSNIAPTPSIDRIAREGALFQNSFCANSICGPSRACILTGKHSSLNGFRRNTDRFDGSQWSFQKDLRASGYTTALIGKWHLRGKPQGFDHWEIFPGQGNYYNPDFITMDGRTHRETGYATDLVTDKTLAWLDSRDGTKPFLMMCQHKAPHRTFAPAIRHLGSLGNAELPEPSNLFDDYATRGELLASNEMSIADHLRWTYDLKIRPEDHEGIPLPGPDEGYAIEYKRMTSEQTQDWNAHFGPLNAAFSAEFQSGKYDDPRELTRWKYRRYIRNYLSTIKAVDESVGRLLDYLDTHGLADNTIVIYSSDQGFYLGEHGWYDKRWMYEESLKMPFVIRWPGVAKPGSRPEAMIQNIDYAPTFLEAAGLPVPDAIQGMSLVSVLRDSPQKPKGWRDSIYYHYFEVGEHNVPEHDGVRTETHKLIHFPAADQWQLFDLKSDPNEMINLYGTAQYETLQSELHRQLNALRLQYDVDDVK